MRLFLTTLTLTWLCLNIIVVNGHTQTTATEHADVAREIWAKDNPTSDELARMIYHFNKAVELEPEEFKWAYNLGTVYYYHEDLENAEAFILQSIPLAKTEQNQEDAESRLTEIQIQMLRNKIAKRQVQGDPVNQGSVKRRIVMKGIEVFHGHFDEAYEPTIPQISTEASPQPLLQHFKQIFPNFNAISEDVFVIVGPDTEEELSQHYLRGVKDFYAFFKKTYFSKTPQSYLSLIISEDPTELMRSARTIDASLEVESRAPFFGFYMPANHLAFATIGGGYGTLLHEMMHALIRNENPDTPRWLEEAMASLYERCIWRDGRLTPLPNWRISMMHGHVTSLGELDDIIEYENVHSRALSNLRLLLVFLDQENKLVDFYKAVLKNPTSFSIEKTLSQLHEDLSESKWMNFAYQAMQDYALEIRLNEGKPQGIELKNLQTALNKILSLNLDVDGYWGSDTEQAVRQFQTQYNLEVTGRFDSKTLDRINREIRPAAIKK